MFTMMATEFAEPNEPLTDTYLHALLDRDSFWAYVAVEGNDVVGGLTAHVLPMTRSPIPELFIYDLAVRGDRHRRGIGSALIRELRRAAAAAGIGEIFVPADNEDTHAVDFYRAQGGLASAVTFFSFAAAETGPPISAS